LARQLLDTRELLPGWYDDWVLFERERLRQRRMYLLDRLSRQLLKAENLPLARATAQACIVLEPLREGPHRTLVRVHLAEGDRVEAFRVYQTFRRRSIAEFGLAPDVEFERLVAPLLAERRLRRSASSGAYRVHGPVPGGRISG
jgi:two-component SAPR family response regulator